MKLEWSQKGGETWRNKEDLEKIEPMYSDDMELITDWGAHLHCPICQFDCVHITDIEVLPSFDSYKAWEGRGEAVVLHFCCENGHHFNMRFGQHKGATYLKVNEEHCPCDMLESCEDEEDCDCPECVGERGYEKIEDMEKLKEGVHEMRKKHCAQICDENCPICEEPEWMYEI